MERRQQQEWIERASVHSVRRTFLRREELQTPSQGVFEIRRYDERKRSGQATGNRDQGCEVRSRPSSGETAAHRQITIRGRHPAISSFRTSRKVALLSLPLRASLYFAAC